MNAGLPARRGIALIIVVGTLSVLAVVATAFVMMAELERKAAHQRMLSLKAYLLARSGVEDALARLGAGQDPDLSASRYGGEDWDNSGGALSALESAQEVYRAGVANRFDCPIRHAMRPTFFKRAAGGNPLYFEIDRRKRGYSGALMGEQGPEGNTYALKVSGGGFHVNDANPQLRRMLGTLCEALDRENGGANDGSPVDEADGFNLVDLRPGSGWSNFPEIRSVALSGNQAKLDALKDYLTLSAWVDRRVIAPNATLAMADKPYQNWGEIKLDPGRGGPPVFSPRAPVDLTWAKARKPALTALVADLSGLYLDEISFSTAGSVVGAVLVSMPDAIGTLRPVTIANTWSAVDNCAKVVDAIYTTTTDLSTWQDWTAFCDTIFSNATAGSFWRQEAMRELLKANFNPNSELNKFSPNRSTWKSTDKSDLLNYSTEFSLVPIQGRRVDSVGRIVGRSGRLLACRTLSVSLPSPQVARISTQREFVTSDLGSLQEPGDEGPPRLPGAATFLSLSQGNSMTWGHKLAGMGGTGIALQSYPEPVVDAGAGLIQNPAGWDGNLQLATVETLDFQLYGVASPPNDMRLLARYDNSLNLDISKSGVAGAAFCRPDTSLVTTAELGNSIWHTTKPSTLYPDGVLSEANRCPAYYDSGHSQGYHELLSYWFKHDFRNTDPAVTKYFIRQHMHRTNYSAKTTGSDSKDQFWYLGYNHRGDVPGPALRCFIENSHEKADLEHEQSFATATTDDGPELFDHRWSLMSFYWDVQPVNTDGYAELCVNKDAQGNGLRYAVAASNNKAATDITAGDLDGTHTLSLGRHDKFWELEVQISALRGADTTFDELALYDFGGGGGDSAGPTAMFASGRWKAGRYYKESEYRAPGAGPLLAPPGEAGSWISAPINLPAGSWLRTVAWTWRLPYTKLSKSTGAPAYQPYLPSPEDAVLANDWPEVEFLNTAANGYLWASGGRSGRLDDQRWDVNRVMNGPFRARVVFRRNTAVDDNTPILDSPVFDDLSYVYLPPGVPEIAGWSEGE